MDGEGPDQPAQLCNPIGAFAVRLQSYCVRELGGGGSGVVLYNINISMYSEGPYQGITKTRLFKYIENFTSKNRNFSCKKL